MTRPGSCSSPRAPINGPEELQPSVTVAICTRNRPRHLKRCLQELSHLAYSNFEVLVVENAPLDEQTRQVAALAQVRYEVEPVLGVSRARNRAAALSRTEFIAYLDDDALPEPSWLRELVAPFQDPQVVIVAGRVLPCGDNEQERAVAKYRGTANDGTVGGDEARIFSRQLNSWFVLAAFGAIGLGASMAFRRSAFTYWPGFDERLGHGGLLCAGEEYQACLELVARGKCAAYTPRSIVRHPYMPEGGDDVRRRYLRSHFGVGAYTAYLLAEYPEHAADTLAYVVRRLLGGPSARNDARPPRPDGVSAWSAVLALCSGPMVYLREGRKALPVRKRSPLLPS